MNKPLPWTAAIFLCWIVAACQTTIGYVTPQLPADVSGHFHSCASGEGSVHMRLRKDGDYLGDINVEWFAATGKPFVYQVYEPLGRTVLSIQFDKAAHLLSVSGSWASGLPPIAVDEEGFLLLDQKRVGIKYSEIPCFLRYKFPMVWLSKVTGFSNNDDTLRLYISDKSRSIILALKRSGPKTASTFCAKIEWKSYFGIVTSNYDLCYDDSHRHKATVTGLGAYTLEWTDDEES